MSKKSKKKETAPEQEMDFLAKEAKEEAEQAPEYTLDIPDDEIWTYKIDGLQQPKVGISYKNARGRKILVVIILLIAISASIFLSVRAVHNNEYQFKELEDGTYELIRYSNQGDAKDIVIDYYVDNDTGEKDYSKPVTVIHEYAFNCDEIVDTITFGKDVKSIDGKSIYSCWWITNVFVDDENPYYCDLNGVLYTKDMKEVIFYPNDHDKALRLQYGYAEKDEKGVQHSLLVDDSGNEMEELWGTTEKYDEAYFDKYNKEIRTYVIPSTVEKIGELAFAYTNIVDLYIPEGVKEIGMMAGFKNQLWNIYSYTTDTEITDTTYKAVDSFSSVYNSLPNGLEYIGSDAFTYDSQVNYLYVPKSVKYIGHHAFYDMVYKDGGELKGVTVINYEGSEEELDAVEKGNQWRPRYDHGLFKKTVDTNYNAQRE